jgi:hypothetical protein
MSMKMYKWKENGQELEDYIVSFLKASLNNDNLKNFKIEKNHIEIGQEDSSTNLMFFMRSN